GAVGRGLGGVARAERSSGRPGLLGELSRREHAHVRDEFFTPGRSDHLPVLPVPAARTRWLSAYPAELLRYRAIYRPRGMQAGAVRAVLRWQQPQRHLRRLLEDQGRRRSRLLAVRSVRSTARARLADSRLHDGA